MVDAVLNQGLPAPIDVQLSGSNIDAAFEAAGEMAADIRKLPGVSDVYIPQDIDYPSLRSTSTASAPASSGSINARWSTTSSPR